MRRMLQSFEIQGQQPLPQLLLGILEVALVSG
jgi:hypothetical protein